MIYSNKAISLGINIICTMCTKSDSSFLFPLSVSNVFRIETGKTDYRNSFLSYLDVVVHTWEANFLGEVASLNPYEDVLSCKNEHDLDCISISMNQRESYYSYIDHRKH